jgi:hypothetical protein
MLWEAQAPDVVNKLRDLSLVSEPLVLATGPDHATCSPGHDGQPSCWKRVT